MINELIKFKHENKTLFKSIEFIRIVLRSMIGQLNSNFKQIFEQLNFRACISRMKKCYCIMLVARVTYFEIGYSLILHKVHRSAEKKFIFNLNSCKHQTAFIIIFNKNNNSKLFEIFLILQFKNAEI